MTTAEVTRILNDAAAGDGAAAEQLLAVIYDQLRAMARRFLRCDGATIEPTALVHEAWLRLRPTDHVGWRHRGHFFGAAAQAMRRILVDHARARVRRSARTADAAPTIAPRGGEVASTDVDPATLLDIDAALRRLEAEHPREARLVELRYFAGLANAETASALGVSIGTVERDWRLARARLQRWLDEPDD